MLLRKDLKISDRPLFQVYRIMGQARNEVVSVKIGSTSKEFKRRSIVRS